jgi:hypothetical protein
MGLTTKEWNVRHAGRDLRVVNTWFSGARLYVDGDLRDTCTELVSVDATRPLLSASLDGPGGRSVVEVFIVSVVTTKAMVCVDGVVVGGDLAGPAPTRDPARGEPYRETSAVPAAAEVSRLQRELTNARLRLGVALLVAAGAVTVASLLLAR